MMGRGVKREPSYLSVKRPACAEACAAMKAIVRKASAPTPKRQRRGRAYQSMNPRTVWMILAFGKRRWMKPMFRKLKSILSTTRETSFALERGTFALGKHKRERSRHAPQPSQQGRQQWA